jgi:hypothetical protein
MIIQVIPDYLRSSNTSGNYYQHHNISQLKLDKYLRDTTDKTFLQKIEVCGFRE